MDCDNITKGQFQWIVILYNTGIVLYFSCCCVLLSHKILTIFETTGHRQGHWVRRDQNIKQYVVSQAVDALVNKPADVAFIV